MKYRVIEKTLRSGVIYQVLEQEPESKQWMEILNEEDEVLEFNSLGEAKEFVDYLREINATLEEKENVVYEV